MKQTAAEVNDRISLYQGIAPKTIGETTWQEVIRQIKAEKFKDQVAQAQAQKDPTRYREFKKTLPAVTFCGTFNGSRSKEHVLSTTGFIIPDLDHIQNIDSVLQLLSRDENIWFAFRSPSGEGVKCGIRATGIKTDEDIKKFYQAVERYFKEV